MSPKPQLSMTDDAVRAFLETIDKASIATMGPDGLPHLSTMYFFVAEGEIRMWTYRKSQKAQNLLRDRRLGFLVEGGEPYQDAKGVSVRGEARLIEEPAEIEAIGRGIYEKSFMPRTGIPYDEGPNFEIQRQVAKRIGIALSLKNVASWDHALA